MPSVTGAPLSLYADGSNAWSRIPSLYNADSRDWYGIPLVAVNSMESLMYGVGSRMIGLRYLTGMNHPPHRVVMVAMTTMDPLTPPRCMVVLAMTSMETSLTVWYL